MQTIITSEMANEIHDKANDEYSIESLRAILVNDYGVPYEETEEVLIAILG